MLEVSTIIVTLLLYTVLVSLYDRRQVDSLMTRETLLSLNNTYT